MTLKEQIMKLQTYKMHEGEDTVYVERDDVLKALEQEPCEDAVSRKDLYNALYDRFHDEDSPNNITEVTLGSVRNFVKGFPSVTPKPKTGHWIKVTNGRGGHECNLCHEYAPSYQSGKEYLTKYCPNCGVKMQEVEE